MRLFKYMVLTFAASVIASVLICKKAMAEEVEIGAAPAMMEAPEREALDMVMAKDLQTHIWQIACGRFPKDAGKAKEYFAALVGLADGEGTFNALAVNDKNKNGSIDRGMWQINSSNLADLKKEGLISGAEDLYNPMKCVNCADFLYWKHYKKYGFSRRSYDGYLYNDGKEHDNIYTRRVWKIQEEWNRVLWE